jgi:hypothetical protein
MPCGLCTWSNTEVVHLKVITGLNHTLTVCDSTQQRNVHCLQDAAITALPQQDTSFIELARDSSNHEETMSNR